MSKMNFRIYKEEDSILFNSKLDNYVLSNMYPCKLLYEGKVFHSVEQLFHWMIFSENKFVREEIMKFKGVCNGFQILLEAGLLPGAMRRNESLHFICRNVELKVENNETMFTNLYGKGEVITIPIAHGEGNYYCDETTLKQLQDNNQIAFTYTGTNPNGSLANIAGITNEKGNVLGMMPHPERAVDELLGSADGVNLFKSIVKHWRESNVVTA